VKDYAVKVDRKNEELQARIDTLETEKYANLTEIEELRHRLVFADAASRMVWIMPLRFWLDYIFLSCQMLNEQHNLRAESSPSETIETAESDRQKVLLSNNISPYWRELESVPQAWAERLITQSGLEKRTN
jgi:hypothetical protein